MIKIQNKMHNTQLVLDSFFLLQMDDEITSFEAERKNVDTLIAFTMLTGKIEALKEFRDALCKNVDANHREGYYVARMQEEPKQTNNQ